MKRYRRRLLLVTLLVSVAVLAVWSGGQDEPGRGAEPAIDDAFWQHWGDGRAELAGYRLTYPRYGEPREGTAVAIFVTEEFAAAAAVKHEDPRRDSGDVYPVVKLNLTQDFSTGFYDYNLMTSAFVSLAPRKGHAAGAPVKVAFSSQEWCGQAYAQAVLRPTAVRYVSHSYFDGEADQDLKLDRPARGAAEDALLLWARGMARPVLAPGASRTIPLLRSLERARLEHLPVDWQRATLSRSEATESVTVPAGAFEARVMRVKLEPQRTRQHYPPERRTVELPGRTWTFWVEEAPPHRVLRWSRSDGLEAEMLGSTRQPYWAMNGPGLESALELLGLEPRPPRTP